MSAAGQQIAFPHVNQSTFRQRRHGELPAFGDGTTFRDLLARSRRLAGHWAENGLSAGDRVLVDLPNDRSFVEARIAATLAGYVAVPIPPDTPGERLGWIAEFTEARAYLGPRSEEIQGIPSVAIDPLAADRAEYESMLASAPSLDKSPRLRGNHLVTINFSEEPIQYLFQ